MTRSSIPLAFLLLTCTLAKGVSAADSAPTDAFPYRAWAISIHAYDWELLEKYVDRILGRAKEYRINTIELHDYTIGERGIVDASIVYKDFSKLHERTSFRHNGERIDAAAREKDYKRFRALAKKIKGAGLKLNVWYHVMRDVPRELFTDYPEIGDLDSGFMWKYLESTLREFFQRVPEVDRLVITSLLETPSVMNSKGKMTRDERLLKLYATIYRACHDSGKELVIRDFIGSKKDFDTFFRVLDTLPNDVYIMTKEVLGDWVHPEMSLNPYLSRYAGRKVVVEFDLFGEYSGQMDVPYCCPRYLYSMIRNIKAAGVQGAVGRVIHSGTRSENFETIFDSPNEINCYAFARYLSTPLLSLETPGVNPIDVDAFDESIWLDWVHRRYGDKASMRVIRALKRTNQIAPLLFDAGGLWFQAHSALPSPNWKAVLWPAFVDRMKKLGIEYLRDEKRQAYELTKQCLDDIESAKGELSEADYRQLRKLFEGALLITRAYQALIETYYQMYLAQSQPDPEGLRQVENQLNSLAAEVSKDRGDRFFYGLANTLRAHARSLAGIKTSE